MAKEAGICPVCRAPMDPKAQLCSNCKVWRAWWRNWLPYIGGMVTMFGILASAGTYVYNHFPRSPHPQLRVISATNNGPIVVLNSGNEDLLILGISFASDEIGRRESHPINQVVKAGAVLTVPMITTEGVQGPSLEEVVTVETDQWDRLLNDIRHKSEMAMHFHVYFATEGDVNMQLMLAERHPNFAAGRGALSYISSDGRWKGEQDLGKVYAVLVKKAETNLPPR